ncbi:Wolframin [Eumeta japonica]|uniref:Wolframin n=1 Tax=Eumeta variegata TaxID=151549 RepID=A0A4C1V389_EUMVA|nr:Wolframin [Eumeta japonica]
MLPNRTTPRKRWAVHDGPQGSLRRLRNQLAEDGCAESQVVLAKQLLEEKCELEADKVSNFKQALEWLICATEQGHPEARRLLHRSIRSGVISAENSCIVRAKACLTASRQEIVARKAARDLFNRLKRIHYKILSLSNGEQYITTAQLERRIREICTVTMKQDEAAEDSDTPSDNERVSALGLGHALEPSQLQAGDQPRANGTLPAPYCLQDEYPEPCPQDDIKNLTVENLVEAAVDYCQGELPLVSYDLTLTDPGTKALDHIPLLHRAFIHPIVFLQVLYLKLLYYFGNFSFSTDGNSIPDALALISLAINILAKYPYEKDTVVHRGWRFLDIHIQNYPSYILGNSIEFCLNARVFFTLLIPLILFFMARRSNWQGMFKYALPHCVTLSWLQMFVICSQGCTMYGLIRGTLGLACTFLFLPLIGVVTLVLPIFACLQYITLTKFLYITFMFLGLVLSLTVTCLLAKTEATKKLVTPIQLAIGFVALVYFGGQFLQSIDENNISNNILDLVGDKKSGFRTLLKNDFSDTDYDESYHISWDDYYSQCHSMSWFESNMAATQIKCAILDGTNVDWQGYIKEVTVKSVTNKWNDFAEILPGFLQEYFKCYYGEEYLNLCQSSESLHSAKDCEFMQNVARQTGRTCHLNNLNEIKLNVDQKSGLEQDEIKGEKHIGILMDAALVNTKM